MRASISSLDSALTPDCVIVCCRYGESGSLASVRRDATSRPMARFPIADASAADPPSAAVAL